MGFDKEVVKGDRFEFGKNWKKYHETLDKDRVIEAEKSLCAMLNVESLDGKRFLDVGSGSGIFSLAARRLGASVHSFDYDPNCVACANELKNRFFKNDHKWSIEQGSILDRDFLKTLGQSDIVYSWGVLHHTGDMWQSLANVIQLAKPGAVLFIAIYNDQGFMSRYWHRIKHIYNAGAVFRMFIKTIFYPWFAFRTILVGLVKYHNPAGAFNAYHKKRGMSVVRDWEDWLGGYPFEVAKPESIIDFYFTRGFNLTKYKSTNRLGCNEFVFRNKGPS